MRKTVGIILAVLCVLGSGMISAHASGSFALDELSMTIEIPDGWTVFTRGMDENDPAFGAMGTDKAKVEELLLSGGLYLDALSADMSAELVVSMAADTDNIFNLNLLSEAELEDALQRIVDVISLNFTVAEHSLYKTEQASFVCASMSGSVNGRTEYIKEYATIINGKDIAVALCSYNGPVSAEYDSALKGVIDSIVFTEILEKPDVMYTPPQDAVRVELPGLKMNIEIPGGWVSFTRDMMQDDPVYAFMGTDKATVDKALTDANEYLHAVQTDSLTEIAVSMTSDLDNVFDYNLLSEAEMDTEAQAIVNNTLKAYPGDEITLTGSYKHPQALFITADWHSPSQNSYQKLYNTVLNGMNINITLITSGKPVTDEQEALLKNAVDSVVFTEKLTKPASGTGIWSVGGAVLLGIIVYNIYAVAKRRKAGKSNTNAGANAGGNTGGNTGGNVQP